jgi:AraC-like DNA-binding protein
MKFEFIAQCGFDFLESFGSAFHIPFYGSKLIIPAELGNGTIRKVDFSPDFKLLFHHYTFHEEFILKRKAPEEKSDLVSIIFYTSALPNNVISNEQKTFSCSKINHSAIEISSIDLNSEIRFPAKTEIFFTVVGIMKPLLSELLKIAGQHTLMDSIMRDDSSFLFHENMWPDIEKNIRHLSLINEQDLLSHFYFRIKVQELIYLLFSKLIKREDQTQQAIGNSDVESLYAVRTLILSDLSKPPKLTELAGAIGMSETKMKLLFNQIFGDSIYNYFQSARMEEAAFLLKQSDYSVSEIGYQLGFTNLSHFSRLFEKHYNITPKKYSSAG